jgi:proteasome assembly chaperone (PAC2) family protein
MSFIHWHTDPPALRQPVLLVALDGFVDAGAVASTAGMFLRHRWKSEVVATFDRDEFIDYRARRPTAVVDSGEVRRLEWPDIELCAASVDGPRDVLLLLGPEPDMRWDAFVSAVTEVAQQLGVEIVLGLGAYPAAVPHTRPTSIVKASNGLAGDLVPEAAAIAAYTGPVGAGTALQVGLAETGMPAVGLWAEVPHYIAGSPHPAAALTLVRLVAATLHTEVDTAELEAAATLHRSQVDEAVAEHPEAGDMVAALEAHVDSGGEDVNLPSGDALAAEIERFLRTQQDG